MKIISSFHDYYDKVLTHGRDDDILYIRKRSEILHNLPEDILPWKVSGKWGYKKPDTFNIIDKKMINDEGISHMSIDRPNIYKGHYQFHEAFALVAGKAYSVWVKTNFGYDEKLNDLSNNIFGGYDKKNILNKIVEKKGNGSNVFNQKPRFIDVSSKCLFDGSEYNKSHKIAYQSAKNKFLEYNFTDFHLELNAPILLVGDINFMDVNNQKNSNIKQENHNTFVVKNPRLADLYFEHVLNPYTCFQDVFQFVGGVAPGRQMPMIQISDKDMIVKKGFDDVYGFRKRPS